MSSIALFYALFTEEKKVREQLSAATGFRIIKNAEIVNDVSQQYNIATAKVERAINGPPSVFNTFTLEREKNSACLKLVMARYLQSSNTIYSGNIAFLIPPAVTHVLRVGLFDTMANRMQRAMGEGLSEKNATKILRKHDSSAAGWGEHLGIKELIDKSLYDIVIPMGDNSPESAVRLILENYQKPAVAEQDSSRQAVIDMALAAAVELALVKKGHTIEVKCHHGELTLQVNKSVTNFSKLSSTLTAITESVKGVQSVNVVTGKDYRVSIYRDQEFTLPPKVLLVDDEQEFAQTLSERLNTRNYGSYPVFDGEQALDLLREDLPDVIVLDLKMPGIGGVEVLRKTKERNPEIEIIVLTGHGSGEEKEQCLELGAYAYLNKPVDISQLTELIDKAYSKVAAAKLADT